MTDVTLTAADPRLGLAPISVIKTHLDRLFGKNEWVGFEPATISVELGLVMDDLLLDKIQVLQILAQDIDLFFTDAAFLLYATEVINNNVADFSVVPTPTSLELAFAISEVKKILEAEGVGVPFNNAFARTVAYFLREDGYSKPVPPFDFIPEDMLERGQTASDMEAKKKAIDAYIEHMQNL